jgi:hypothetical protein
MRYSTTGQQLADSQHDLIDRFGLVNDGARAGGQSRGVQFPVPRFSQAGAEQLAGQTKSKSALNNIFKEIGDAAAVTPLVVVPAY